MLMTVTYYDRTWIIGQIRLQQWNYYDYNELRINNFVETVDISRRSELPQKLKLEQFAAGATQPPRKKRYI